MHLSRRVCALARGSASNSDSPQFLEPGVAFSIEPGVYLPGRFGAHVEDIIVVTNEGCRTLTGLPHELHVGEVPAGD